ncbi:MAG: hypothetical protein PVF58_15250 [Candidatus Methanofastidiosia archaeon]
MIQIDKETTSTNPKNGEEVNKYTGLSKTKEDTNEPKNEQPLDELLGTAIALYLPREKATKIAVIKRPGTVYILEYLHTHQGILE